MMLFMKNNFVHASVWTRVSTLLFASVAIAACNDDDTPQSTCEEGETQEIACDDGAGLQTQICIDGDWDNDGECDIPADGCTDGDTQTIECTDNKEGEQAQICEEGEWVDDGECALPTTRLTQVKDLNAGVDCIDGGRLVTSGIDANHDGELQEEEIDTYGLDCVAAGRVWSQEVSLDADEDVCAHGGIALRVGIDEYEDRLIDDDELAFEEIICREELNVCENQKPLAVEWAMIPPNPGNFPYVVHNTYDVLVKLNRPVDSSTLYIQKLRESELDPTAEYEFSVDEDDDHLIRIAWTPQDYQDNFWDSIVLVADACGSALADVVTLTHTTSPEHRSISIEIPYGDYPPGSTATAHIINAVGMDECQLKHPQRTNEIVATVNLLEADTVSFEIDEEFYWGYEPGKSPRAMPFDCFFEGEKVAYDWYTTVQGPPSIKFVQFLSNTSPHLPFFGGYQHVFLWGENLKSCTAISPSGHTEEVTFDTIQSQAIVFLEIREPGRVRAECVDHEGNLHEKESAEIVTLGKGIFGGFLNLRPSWDATWYVGADAFGLDGRCEATIENGDTVIEGIEFWLNDGPASFGPFAYRGSVDGADDRIDPDLGGQATVTCWSYDETKQDTVVIPAMP